MTDRAYFDWNATSPMRPAVMQLVAETVAEPGNASSVHGFGRRARARVEMARRQLASLVSADQSSVVFTSGATESNNLVLGMHSWRRVLVTATEHDSVRMVRSDAVIVPVSSQGVIDIGSLEKALGVGDGPTLVSVMLANNETGVLQPISEVAKVVHAAGAYLHSDAVQAVGRLSIDWQTLGVDYLSLSSHKIGGPQGVGALVVRDGAPFQSMLKGGGQERGRRAGTENVAGIAGFGVAAELARADVARMAAVGVLRDRFEAACRRSEPMAYVFGAETRRLANTSCISMPRTSAQLQLMAFDLKGMAVSSGAACSSGKVHPSHVLAAMVGEGPHVDNAIRISIGTATTEGEIDRLIAAWCGIAGQERAGTVHAVAA